MIPNTGRRRPPGLHQLPPFLLLLLLLLSLTTHQTTSQPIINNNNNNNNNLVKPSTPGPWGIIILVSLSPSPTPLPPSSIIEIDTTSTPAPNTIDDDDDESNDTPTPDNDDINDVDILVTSTPMAQEVDTNDDAEPSVDIDGVVGVDGMNGEEATQNASASTSGGGGGDDEDGSGGSGGKVVGGGDGKVKGKNAKGIGRRVGFGVGGAMFGLVGVIVLVVFVRTRQERSRGGYEGSSFMGDSRFSSSFLTNVSGGKIGGLRSGGVGGGSGRSWSFNGRDKGSGGSDDGSGFRDVEEGQEFYSSEDSPWDAGLDKGEGIGSVEDGDDWYSSSSNDDAFFEAYQQQHGGVGIRRSSVERVYDNMYTNEDGDGVVAGAAGGASVVAGAAARSEPQVVPEVQNLPVDLAIVLDCSSSLSSEAYALIKKAITRQGGLIDSLATQTQTVFRASFIQFADMSSLICPVTDDMERLKTTINNANQHASTLDGHGYGREVHLALNRCRKQLLPTYSEDEIAPQQARFKRVLLICCSGFTEGGSSSTGFAATEAAKILKDNDVNICTVAIGYYCGPALRKLASGDPPAHLAVTEARDFDSIIRRIASQILGRGQTQ